MVYVYFLTDFISEYSFRSYLKTMNRSRFVKLSHAERAKWLYFNGKLVASIRYYKHKINLYLLDRLYVEVFYNHLDDRVDQIEILDEGSKRMNFYADQIKLPSDLIA